jgi:hypothetical protein
MHMENYLAISIWQFLIRMCIDFSPTNGMHTMPRVAFVFLSTNFLLYFSLISCVVTSLPYITIIHQVKMITSSVFLAQLFITAFEF